MKLRDGDFDFGGEYVTGSATIAFTASDDGHERNGVFFQ